MLIERWLSTGAVLVPFMAPELLSVATRACQCGPVVMHSPLQILYLHSFNMEQSLILVDSLSLFLAFCGLINYYYYYRGIWGYNLLFYANPLSNFMHSTKLKEILLPLTEKNFEKKNLKSCVLRHNFLQRITICWKTAYLKLLCDFSAYLKKVV